MIHLFTTWFSGVFNAREIATFLWVSLFLSVAVFKREIRLSILSVLVCLFSRRILFLICLFLLYNVGIIYLLQQLGFWNRTMLKDTIIWCLFSGFIICVNIISNKDKHFFKKTLFDTLKLVALLEYLANTYTFTLLIELIICPILASIIIIDTYAKFKEEYKSIKSCTSTLLSLIGIFVLLYIFKNIVLDYKNLANPDNIKNVLLVPILTISIIPFAYLLLIYSTYELMFIRLNFGNSLSKEDKNYAKKKIRRFCLLSLGKLNLIQTYYARHIMKLSSKDDIDEMISSCKSGKVNEDKITNSLIL